jgi:hypothetical protein
MGTIFSAACILVATSHGSGLNADGVTDDAVYALFNSSASACGAFFIAALWGPLFTESRKWTFAAASVLLIACAAIALTGAIASTWGLLSQPWWMMMNGMVVSLFAGWTSVAAGLSVGITTRVYNHGIDTDVKEDDRAWSPFPIALSIMLATLAILFANPILPVPLAIATLFMKDMRRFYVWASLVVCAIGIAIGAVNAF